MGCNIHFFVEIRKKDGKWHHIYEGMNYSKELDVFKGLIGRNYTLFAFLADVRNTERIKPLSKPRGLPPDVSKEVMRFAKEYKEVYGGEQYNSWFSLEELSKVKWENLPFFEKIKYFKQDIINRLYLFMEEKKLKKNEIRIVFWFDNA